MSANRELRVSAWGIRNPIPIAVIFIAAVLAGTVSYFGLPIKNYPNLEFPAVLVTVTRNGTAPAEMETQVTRPVENALAGLPSIQAIDFIGRGYMLADVVAIIGSMDVVFGEIDR